MGHMSNLKIDCRIQFLEIIEEIHHRCVKPLAVLSYSYIKKVRDCDREMLHCLREKKCEAGFKKTGL